MHDSDAGPKNLSRGPGHEVSGPGALSGSTTLYDVIFSGYAPRCGQTVIALQANPLSTDVNHPVTASLVRYEPSTTTPPFVFTTTTDHGRVNATGVALATCLTPTGCDADNHRLIQDVDGSFLALTGTPRASSIFSR